MPKALKANPKVRNSPPTTNADVPNSLNEPATALVAAFVPPAFLKAFLKLAPSLLNNSVKPLPASFSNPLILSSAWFNPCVNPENTLIACTFPEFLIRGPSCVCNDLISSALRLISLIALKSRLSTASFSCLFKSFNLLIASSSSNLFLTFKSISLRLI